MTLDEFQELREAVEYGDAPMEVGHLLQKAYETQLKRAEEAERRVRWLEKVIMRAHIDHHKGTKDCISRLESVLRFPSGSMGNTIMYLAPVAVKPTPKDFK
jgi:hypothetical protein